MKGRIAGALGAAVVGALAMTTGLPAGLTAAGAADARTVTMGGGSGIVFGHDQPVTETYGGACTLTAIGFDKTGNLVGLTNAHCFYDNDGHQWPGDKVYFDESRPGTSLQPNQVINPDLDQARFICRNCGVVAHADRNASRNIAHRGEAVWTAGRESRVPAAKAA